AQRAARRRLGRREHARVPARRRRRLDGLGGVREALGRTRDRRVHRPGALRGRGAARRRALRPAALDGDSVLPAPTAPQAPPLRPLDKPRAVEVALDLIRSSAIAARSLTGYLDYGDGDAFWRPPRSESRHGPPLGERGFAAPRDTVSRGLDFLAQHRRELPTQ